jgi:predicted transcriptional regulator
MIIKKYLVRLIAMSQQMTRAELIERCDVPEYTLDAALRGQDIPVWEGHNITSAVDEWEEEGAADGRN